MRYAPLRWELKQRYPGYEMNQSNIILDVLGRWSKDLDVTLAKLVGSKVKGVLKKIQKACLSGTFNIARTFKVVIYLVGEFCKEGQFHTETHYLF